MPVKATVDGRVPGKFNRETICFHGGVKFRWDFHQEVSRHYRFEDEK
tara:strand:+ start:375 stop:515 length:141 start_codon:yes stop_codon:yes gene_type:complete